MRAGSTKHLVKKNISDMLFDDLINFQISLEMELNDHHYSENGILC